MQYYAIPCQTTQFSRPLATGCLCTPPAAPRSFTTLCCSFPGLRYPAARTTLKTLHCVFYRVLEIVFPRGNWQNPPHPPLWHNSPPFAPPSSDILQEINCFALQLNISIHLLLDSLLFSSLNKWVSVLFSQKLPLSSTHQFIACCSCSL